MKINKEKVINYWNKLIKNKAFLYFSFCIVLLLFCFTLNITFAKYTHTKTIGANITIGQLKYNMQINNGELEDRILRISKNSTRLYTIGLTSLNKFDTKYELIYHVCNDEKCSSYIDMPNDLDIRKSSSTSSDIQDNIDKNGFNSITIVGINSSTTTDYYIKIDLNAGYIHNELTLSNQINLTYYDNDITVVAYVDGVEVKEFPNTIGYVISSSECKVNGTPDNNIKVNGYWDYTNDKWIINVNNISKSNTICDVNFETAPTLAEAIRKNYPTIETPKTTPGSKVSTTTEALLASTDDDYGTSLYFRGAVENNYVEFANKCWRIVRITGNNAIKIVLYNDNENKVANPCNASNDSSTAAFAKYDGTKYESYFNSPASRNAHIGFMYGKAGTCPYATEHANTNDSTMLKNLKQWYDLSFNEQQKNKLADTIWCNDKSIVSTSVYGNGCGIESTQYSASIRTNAPTLVCPSDDLGVKISKFTASDTVNGNGALKGYKIGLLTADEIVFAGGSWNTKNTSYYLYKNATGYWLTMTPHIFRYGGSLSMVGVRTDGEVNFISSGGFGGVRPAVSLISTITISDGTGTSSDPFIIN